MNMSNIRIRDTASLPMSDEDYEKELPIPSPEEDSKCACCGKKYNRAEFLALPLPANGKGEWEYPDSPVVLAIRQCSCGNTLARREK